MLNNLGLSLAPMLALALSHVYRTAVVIAVACAFQAPRPAYAQSGEGAPRLVQQFGDWAVYSGTVRGARVCFAMARPSSAETNPPNRPRDPVYLFVTSRPGENVRSEVSIILGYTHKPGADATADVGGKAFSMQTQTDNAWLRSAAEDDGMVDAMRRAGDMVVKGTSSRGTQTTDRYNLRGLSQSLDRMSQECR